MPLPILPQTLPLPITKGVYRNVDGEALSDYNYQLFDGYLDELSYHVRRPGLAVYCDLGLGTNYPVTGLFWWPQKSIVIAVAGGHIFKVQNVSGSVMKTDLGGVTLTSGINATFATDGTYAYIAAGGQILFTDGTAAPAAIADTDAPTVVTHLAWIDGYLLAAGDVTNRYYLSVVNNAQSWNAGDLFSASGNSDNIVGIKVSDREIYLFGSISTEIWENTGSYPAVFQRIAGGYFDVGCIAAYSPVVYDDGVVWLSHDRRFVRYSGKAIEQLSTPYDKEIEAMSAVADCLGNFIKIDGKPFLEFQFPTADRTLILNLVNNTWSEWRRYNTTTGMYDRFLGTNICNAPGWGATLVGSRTQSVIYSLSRSNLDDAGSPIRFSLQSGHIDRDTPARKRCYELTMRVRRGEPGQTAAPLLMYRWRDQNQAWSNWHTFSLGATGDRYLIQRAKNLGVYQTRQWEFAISDSVACSFGDVRETFLAYPR